MIELECLFAAPGAANTPEAVHYVRYGNKTYIVRLRGTLAVVVINLTHPSFVSAAIDKQAYASGAGVVILKNDLSLYTTLALDDALPSRSSAASSESAGGIAVDARSQQSTIAVWRGKQAVIWSCSFTGTTQPPIWKPISSLTIAENILSVSISSNTLIVGTFRTIECWTADLGSDVPIFDCVWTRSSGPCEAICIASDRSHIAWFTQTGSEAYIQRLKTDSKPEGPPQVLRHSKRLARISWRNPGDLSGSEPCLITQTIDSAVRLYTPVLDDPFWFQLVAALDLDAAMRKLTSGVGKGKAPVVGRAEEAMPFVLETVASKVEKGSTSGMEGGTTFIAWIGADSKLYSAEIKGIDKRPPQLVQIKLSRPSKLESGIQDKSPRSNELPGALRFDSRSSAEGRILAVPARTPGVNAPYGGLVQYAVQAAFVKSAGKAAKPVTMVPGPGLIGETERTISQGFQPRANLISAGPDGHLLFESNLSPDRVLDIALGHDHDDKDCTGNDLSRWCLEEPDQGDERVLDKGMKSMKVFDKAGIRLSGSAAGLRLDRRVGRNRWQEAYTLDKSEAWESWSAVFPYELTGMGQILGCFDIVVIALCGDPWGLDSHAWRATIKLDRATQGVENITRETVTLPVSSQHEHACTTTRTNGWKKNRKEWKNIPMSHKESKTLKGDIHADGYWRVPNAFAISDGSGEVVMLDLAAYPGKAPVSQCLGHALTGSKGNEGLKVFPQGVVMHVDRSVGSTSLWRPSNRCPRQPEWQVLSQNLFTADLMSSDDGHLLLAVGERTSIKVFCQSRLELGSAGSSAWRSLATFDISKQSPYPITGMSWLPRGEIALTASRQLLVAGYRSKSEAVTASLLDLVMACNAPLPLYHPVNVEAELIWDRSKSGLEVDKSGFEDKSPAGRSLYRHLLSAESMIGSDTSMAPDEKRTTNGIRELITDLEASGLNIDRAGLRSLVTLQASLRAEDGTQSACWESVVWASRSATQEALIRNITSRAKDQRILWPDVRRTGAFLWITSDAQARALAEEVARNQFLATDRNPIACSLLYFALGKKTTVHGLWRQISGHAEQNAMLKFLINDFTLPRWRSAATKNAYALLGKQRYEYAAAFFVLAGQVKDAVNICVKHLKDWQLGLGIARLADPTVANDLFRDVIEQQAVPLAVAEGSRWLSHWTCVKLGNKEGAIAAVLGKPSQSANGHDMLDQADSGPVGTLDPALLALLADLKVDEGLAEARRGALIGSKEMHFVLDCARAYWRMGCCDLANHIMATWKFEAIPSMKRKESPKKAPLLNGNAQLKAAPAAAFAEFEGFGFEPKVVKTRSEKAGVMAIGQMKDSKSSQGAADFDMGSFF